MPGLRIVVLAERPRGGTSGAVDYAERLGAELRSRSHTVRTEPDGRADVAIYNHAPYAGGVLLGWLRAARRAASLRRSAARLIVVYHEIFGRSDDRLRMRFFELAQRWTFARLDRLADATVVADRARAEQLARLVPRARPPALIPVGPNIPVPAEPVARPSAPLVLAFGLLQRRRDLETLVEACALLRQTVPDVQLVLAGDLAGDPPRLAALRARAERLGAPVELTGRLPAEEVAAAFARARAFVTPYVDAVSLGSGTLAAAFAFGLPVVAFETARLDPALVAGEHLLVAPRSPGGLAQVIEAALAADADRVGRAGRALYERELSWARIGDRFESLLCGSRARA